MELAMAEEEAAPVPVARLLKKPVPLPRSSLQVKAGMSSDDGSLQRKNSKGLIRGDWKAASEMMQEKGKQVKNEVHRRLEKTVRNVMTKRRSVHPKSSTKECVPEHLRSASLPDDSVFSTICFQSPLGESSRQASVNQSDSDASSEGSFYTTSDLPPSYPPPGLPDESVYDEVTSGTSSEGPCSYYSDSNSIYEDLTKFHTARKPFLKKNQLESDSDDSGGRERVKRSDSWSFYDQAEQNDSRYEVIEEVDGDGGHDDCFNTDITLNRNTLLTPVAVTEDAEAVLRDPGFKSARKGSTTSVLYQFDPLLTDTASQTYDLLSEISESIPALQDALSKCNTEYLAVDEALYANVHKKTSFSEGDMLNKKTAHVFPIHNARHTVTSGEGIYGQINKGVEVSDVRASVLEEVRHLGVTLPPPAAPPPIPPRRLDSISSLTTAPSLVPELNLEVSEEQKEKLPEKLKSTKVTRWSSMKRMARVVAENIENTSWTSNLTKKIERKQRGDSPASSVTDNTNSTFYEKASTEEAELMYVPVLNHSGVLFRPGELARWGVLAQRKLTIFTGKDSPDVKDTIPVDTILSLKSCMENKIGGDGTVQYHCFEISTRTRNAPFILAAPSASERHVWMRKMLESVTPAFPVKLSFDYAKAGWCYMKDGISRDWVNASLLLHQRALYLAPRNGSMIVADLRKARCITLQDSELRCKKASEAGQLLVIDLQDQTLYLQMDCPRETKAWKGAVTDVARANGPSLEEQQLTKDDVPIVVEKCVNFIHTNGSMSEGIYRRNGSSSVVTKLLSSLSADAWSVQLTKPDYTEYDVSSVLKRFLRDLPESLFPAELHQSLRTITECADDSMEEKLTKYKEVLSQLPRVNLLTAKRLMGHLYFVDKLRDTNLMGADNLAAIWGPTLLHIQSGTVLDPNWSRVESAVVNDLITYYPSLFQVERAELEREWKILEVLQNFHSGANTQLQLTVPSKKPSGDLKIWVHLKSKGDTVSVSITPQKTAEEVCKELCSRLDLASHQVTLEEVICNDTMFRPLHHTERVLETVLRWSYWSEQDRKDNCLVLQRNDILQSVVPLAKPPVLCNEELRYADQRSKSFKSYLFEVAHANLCYYRDKTCSTKVGEWQVENLVWYLGHETKRNPHAGWAITFLAKDKQQPRTKDRPYFGHTICGASEEQKLKVMAALLAAQYGQDIVPAPQLLH